MEQQYDDNVLIGFFASTANFSREALESVVKFVDLGENNKLILETNSEEKIIGAAIVSSKDNNELVSVILSDIIQDFIDDFSPDYDQDEISRGNMDRLIQENLKGKTGFSLPIRIILTWIILVPMAIILTILNIWATEYLVISSERGFFTLEQVLTRTFPQVVLISFVELIVVFGLPNLISGYFMMDLKLITLNSGIYFALIVLSYFLSVQPVLLYVILSFFPLIFMISLGAGYIGFRIGVKKKLLKARA
ncbi:MAG: hypothetical protein GF316_13005 [Candidatus Lokiarchaeota archaeon]|nr:hypothetical protein [Candidatus Lokiarchaeota archaeon]